VAFPGGVQESGMSENPTLVSSTEIFKGKVFTVRRDRLRTGEKTYDLDIVEHAQSYAVMARPSPGEVLLVKQYRHAASADLWEFPAGSADEDEDPKTGALRELREETGYSAGRIEQIYAGYLTPGFCTEFMRFFVADDLQAGATQFDEDEDIQTRCISIDEAFAMLRRGEITDAKTALGLLLLTAHSCGSARGELPG